MSVSSSVEPPAPSRAASPPNLLLTLLGDYWWGRPEPLPSAALVALLGDFGVSAAAARAALSRQVRRGLLHAERSGRTTGHRLSDRAQRILGEGAIKLFSPPSADWDGQWSVLAFSAPETSRALRDATRNRLRWLGFAPLYDGLWVSPHDRLTEALAELHSRGMQRATGFRAVVPEGEALVRPESAWDLTELADRYREFAAIAEPMTSQHREGSVDEVTALVDRTWLTVRWRVLVTADPALPEGLVPGDWPGEEARRAFLDAYDALGPAAAAHVAATVARFSAEAARLVTARRP